MSKMHLKNISCEFSTEQCSSARLKKTYALCTVDWWWYSSTTVNSSSSLRGCMKFWFLIQCFKIVMAHSHSSQKKNANHRTLVRSRPDGKKMNKQRLSWMSHFKFQISIQWRIWFLILWTRALENWFNSSSESSEYDRSETQIDPR